MTWTPERVETLKRYLDEGLSWNDIALLMGVTRNSIAGAVNRLNLFRAEPSASMPRQADGRLQRDTAEEHDRDNRDLDILAHIDAGYGLRETARMLGVDQSCVARIVGEAKTREAA